MNLINWLSNLKVSQKIGLGYALALGIAVSGTTLGFSLGQHYYAQADREETYFRNELQLLQRIQARVLQTRTHQQQLIPLLEFPDRFQDEYSHMLVHQSEIAQLWNDMKVFVKTSHQFHDDAHVAQVTDFLQDYDAVPSEYAETIEELVAEIQTVNLEDAATFATTQNRLLTFTNSDLALEFDGISDDLVGILDQISQELERAIQAKENSIVLANRIVIISIVLSVLIAIILAVITSRLIVAPLEKLTTFAQETTQNADFQSQVTGIDRQDEIGRLAQSFNSLIASVQSLLDELKTTQVQMVQSEKMSALGQMVAGVAHEINNPVNFIHGNLKHVQDYTDDLLDLTQLYAQHHIEPVAEIQDKIEEADLEFMQDDLPKMLNSMKVGTSRIRNIVLSLRNFSRLDEADFKDADLHEGIDSTLLILEHRLKAQPMRPKIEVIRQYGKLPPVECYPSQLNQVFMNILVNAIDAIDEAHTAQNDSEKPPAKPQITIRTEQVDDDWAKVAIADTGRGIPEESQKKIFDPFYTTKAVGKGTGMGMSISHQIITENHGGKLDFRSSPNQGTEFIIQIPVRQTVASNKTKLTQGNLNLV
ncbi:MAG: sensor histidine kinase [Spirulinaceae cyanobacterium]